jgi:hypothetical protein
MADTAATLISGAQSLGYDSLSDRGIMECLLYASQSGGGIGEVLTGTVDPAADPTDVTGGAIYYNRTDGVIWQWNPDTLVWE